MHDNYEEDQATIMTTATWICVFNKRTKSRFVSVAGLFPVYEPFPAILVLSMLWNDLFCSCQCIDYVSTWSQIFRFFFSFHLPTAHPNWGQGLLEHTLQAKWLQIIEKWFQIDTRSYIFIRQCRCRRRRLCLNSLVRPSVWMSFSTSPAGPKCYNSNWKLTPTIVIK